VLPMPAVETGGSICDMGCPDFTGPKPAALLASGICLPWGGGGFRTGGGDDNNSLVRHPARERDDVCRLAVHIGPGFSDIK